MPHIPTVVVVVHFFSQVVVGITSAMITDEQGDAATTQVLI